MKWGLCLAAVTVWLAVACLPDDKLHIVFCNVGQGDAILMMYKSQQLLVDSGSDAKVLGCLARHMPFFDRRIESLVITHLDSDHAGGAASVAKRYSFIEYEPVLVRGERLQVGKIGMKIIWPEEGMLVENKISEENEGGIVGEIEWGNFKLLLTADVTVGVYGQGEVSVVKLPHHGSKTGVTQDWLKKLSPEMAIISVGKNSYGHPAPEILKMLDDLGIKTLRTDADGEIEIVTDGDKYWVKVIK